MSSLGCQLDLEKVKLTFQILPSVKKSLDRILVSLVVIVVYPVTMFCISFLNCKGSVACDATFGTDPLVMRADLVESPEKLFFSMQHSGQNILRGEKLNYNNCTSLLLRKSQNLLFLAPEVQWALKVYHICSIHVFFKCFEPCPYLVCHVTTVENV